MRKEQKNKLIAGFIVVMFVGSGVAFAIISAFFPGGEPQSTFIINEPLTNQEEAYYLQRNIVVMRYYYSQDCIDCYQVEPIVDSLAEAFNGFLFVEKIDVDEFPDESADYTAPTLYIKGKEIKEITSDFNEVDIYLDVCSLFFAPVQQCSI